MRDLLCFYSHFTGWQTEIHRSQVPCRGSAVRHGCARTVIRISRFEPVPARTPEHHPGAVHGTIQCDSRARRGPRVHLWTSCTMLCVFMKKTSRSAFRCRVAAWQSRMVAIWTGEGDRSDHLSGHHTEVTQRTHHRLPWKSCLRLI